MNNPGAQFVVIVLALTLFSVGFVAAVLAARAVWRWTDDLELHFPNWPPSRRHR